MRDELEHFLGTTKAIAEVEWCWSIAIFSDVYGTVVGTANERSDVKSHVATSTDEAILFIRRLE